MRLQGPSDVEELEEEGLVSQENSERETKGRTVAEEGLVSRTDYKRIVVTRLAR